MDALEMREEGLFGFEGNMSLPMGDNKLDQGLNCG